MEPSTIVLLVVAALILIFVLRFIFGSFFTVDTAHAGVVQRLGKFLRIAPRD
jgi:regulator of protease activity HflC (stomatin/prohibitin superfamily)